MYVRIKPGEDYRELKTDWYGKLPLTLEKSTIVWLKNQLNPDQWYVYTTLLWYEHIKIAGGTPTLEAIWTEHCKEHMTLDRFKECVEYLHEFIVDDEEHGMLLRLVDWQKED